MEIQKMPASPLLSLSPSFRTCSSTRLAEIAARVVEEFRDEYYSDEEEVFLPRDDDSSELIEENEEGEEGEEGEEDEEYEFSFMLGEPLVSPISADEIFCDGKIRPMCPAFDVEVVAKEESVRSEEVVEKKVVRLPLKKLLTEDLSSCSSSEADELDGVPPGTYCVWKPKPTPAAEVAAEEKRCKKSSSTGTSKRWRFRDLMYRSNSEGKDSFVFLTPKKNNAKVGHDADVAGGEGEVAGKVNGGESPAVVARGKEGDRRRSYLPYRKDLVGFLTNVNGLNRNLTPF